MDRLLGGRELDVMELLWERGSGTVTEVRAALGGALAYTTVLTFLQRLEEKGYLRHTTEGRIHRYRPRIHRRTVGARAIRHLIDTLFRGVPGDALTQLVADDRLSATEIRRLRRLLADRLHDAEPRTP